MKEGSSSKMPRGATPSTQKGDEQCDPSATRTGPAPGGAAPSMRRVRARARVEPGSPFATSATSTTLRGLTSAASTPRRAGACPPRRKARGRAGASDAPHKGGPTPRCRACRVDVCGDDGAGRRPDATTAGQDVVVSDERPAAVNVVTPLSAKGDEQCDPSATRTGLPARTRGAAGGAGRSRTVDAARSRPGPCSPANPAERARTCRVDACGDDGDDRRPDARKAPKARGVDIRGGARRHRQRTRRPAENVVTPLSSSRR